MEKRHRDSELKFAELASFGDNVSLLTAARGRTTHVYDEGSAFAIIVVLILRKCWAGWDST